MTTEVRTPAAQYLRMSLDEQKYSLENQAAAIQKYANLHGYYIVQTYSDAGKSGLALRYRKALRALLNDVVSGKAPFRVILVYDISRWGRFQDVDESAHYEFLCKQARVPVHYCAEPFPNDGTLSSVILKAMKRTMAREYSRELGVKVYEGKKRLVKLGYRMGGCPGYGFRRMLIASSGKRKQLLEPHERKSLVTDRVVLVPGPRREREAIRLMFQMAASGRRATWIARELNRRGYRYLEGRPFDTQRVICTITSPKYAGDNVWGRTSLKLQSPRQVIPPEQWVRKSNAFMPLVDRATFDAAQRLMAPRWTYGSNEDLLRRLRRLLARKGRLSAPLIDSTRGGPSANTYRVRFGSLYKAYELVGYHGDDKFREWTAVWKRIRALRDDLLTEAAARCPATMVIENRRSRGRLLRLQSGAEVSFLMCRSLATVRGQRMWAFNPLRSERSHPTLLALLNEENRAVDFVYFFSHLQNAWPSKFGIGQRWLSQGKRLADMEEFYRRATELTDDYSQPNDGSPHYPGVEQPFDEKQRNHGTSSRTCLKPKRGMRADAV